MGQKWHKGMEMDGDRNKAQSDRMLSIGDGWTHVGVPKVCPKKGKNVNRVAQSPDRVVRWVGRCGWSWQMVVEGQEMAQRPGDGW